ncbi:MAG TPA: aspartate/glutamate racemase family protein [Stellaceae bacterium]|nr:aspartate/glutamate racemase family protein [Stellaceae bacterium]
MIGWRARLGFLVPPGNPTVEPEMIALAPQGVSVHFQRMMARGEGGSHEGQAARNRMMIEHLEESASLLAMVKPAVIVVAHTATSYTLGRDGEARLLARLEKATGTRVVTAFGAIAAALERLGARRLALGTPYSEETTRQGKEHLAAHGFEIVRCERMPGVANIYDETPERAYRLARMADAAAAQAVLLSGTGLPTLPVLEALEADLKKPVLSSNAAMMWHALRLAGVGEAIAGYGRLLRLD